MHLLFDEWVCVDGGVCMRERCVNVSTTQKVTNPFPFSPRLLPRSIPKTDMGQCSVVKPSHTWATTGVAHVCRSAVFHSPTEWDLRFRYLCYVCVCCVRVCVCSVHVSSGRRSHACI